MDASARGFGAAVAIPEPATNSVAASAAAIAFFILFPLMEAAGYAAPRARARGSRFHPASGIEIAGSTGPTC
jgi:hypothetical protein